MNTKYARPASSPEEPASIGVLRHGLGDAIERMIRLQMSACPDHWSEPDKRGFAERTLFGEA